MKWYKYPEEKPDEASGIIWNCFIRCELPPLKDFPKYGPAIARRIGMYHNGVWNDFTNGKAIPFSDDCKVTHWMLLDSIPWPEDAPLPTNVFEYTKDKDEVD